MNEMKWIVHGISCLYQMYPPFPQKHPQFHNGYRANFRSSLSRSLVHERSHAAAGKQIDRDQYENVL